MRPKARTNDLKMTRKYHTVRLNAAAAGTAGFRRSDCGISSKSPPSGARRIAERVDAAFHRLARARTASDERLMANVGTTIIHRVPLPQPLLELAGTTAVWEDLHQTGPSGLRIASGGRRQQTYRIPPDLVRSLPAGQAVIVRQGHWGHVAVAQPS